MRVHHLNCTTMCPIGGRWMDGHRGPPRRALLVCHCLLLETDAGLVLVDTGFGNQDVAHPHLRLSGFFRMQLRPQLRHKATALHQMKTMGFDPSDVRHIVLTHLDFDHAGGLDDFPEATVHLLAAERDAAMAQRTWLDRRRFRPRQWQGVHRWRVYPSHTGERWFDFEAVSPLDGLPPEVLMVPLTGHTLGHAGVAVDTGEGWLLHAGDAYFFREEMDPRHPRCPPGLRLYQWMMQKDARLRRHNQERLRDLVRRHGGGVTVFSAHDPVELERLQLRSRLEPTPPLRGLDRPEAPLHA